MHAPATAFVALAATASAAVIGFPNNISTSGFENAQFIESQGGQALCVQGNVPVTASSSQGITVNTEVPTNQSVFTQSTLGLLGANAQQYMQSLSGPQRTINGTYKINARLCFPKSTGYAPGSNVQILTHGVGFDKTYWDVAPGYSYVDAAAVNGSTTFLYDRLGIGYSAHPDPIATVQAPFEVAILHELTQLLRQGHFAATKYSHVVGVGHSFGSILTVGQANQFPKDIDAAVLTGFSTNMDGMTAFLSGLNLQIAAENVPERFYGLNNAYLIAGNIVANQFGFLKFPGYPPKNLAIAEKTKETFTIGEIATMSLVAKAATQFTGPIDVVNGDADLPFCNANCTAPTNKLTVVKQQLFPNASNSSTTYAAPNAGHGLNLHYSAYAAYTQIQNFIKQAGFA